MDDVSSLARVGSELRDGTAVAKCRQCGCMKDALLDLHAALPVLGSQEAEMLRAEVDRWLTDMQPIKYACLGCDHCIAAAAGNLFVQAFPEASDGLALACGFEIRSGNWPAVPGEYLLLDNGSGPVAVSTLGSLDLPEKLAALRPQGLAIVGKTETENIGLDKIIKNTIANPALRYLILAGHDAEGHYPGQTLLALAANGVNDKLRVVGSQGKRPVLRNVTALEIEAFRQQVQIVDMIGCDDAAAIAAKVVELAGVTADGCADASCSCHNQAGIGLPMVLNLAPTVSACGCNGSCEAEVSTGAAGVPVIEAQAPAKIELDRVGYFVVILQRDRSVIVTEHYGYDDTLLHVIEGKDARSIYWTVIENGWVSQLSHAAYLGKELAKAELAFTMGFKYVQDGA